MRPTPSPLFDLRPLSPPLAQPSPAQRSLPQPLLPQPLLPLPSLPLPSLPLPSLLLLLLWSCVPAGSNDTEAKAQAIEVTAKDRKLAQLQFQSYCASCHGKYGRGDGPTAKSMVPKPRNWTDTNWQKSVTDERLYHVIRAGGAKLGLSPLMAPNPQYGENPAVLRALVEIVRSFGE